MENNVVVLKEIEERLLYVMSTKEAAVQQTLADTEDSLAMIGALKALVATTENNLSPIAGIEFLPQATILLDKLQERLTHILMTQGYQDLTGQVLKRVMSDLSAFDQVSMQAQKSTSASQGFGPAALRTEKDGRVEAQDDVDDLLNSLGI
jgi:chemotaxis regulatin CheY-phosphate phosphatase CheZ